MLTCKLLNIYNKITLLFPNVKSMVVEIIVLMKPCFLYLAPCCEFILTIISLLDNATLAIRAH